jgi:hypothetical protein
MLPYKQSLSSFSLPKRENAKKKIFDNRGKSDAVRLITILREKRNYRVIRFGRLTVVEMR